MLIFKTFLIKPNLNHRNQPNFDPLNKWRNKILKNEMERWEVALFFISARSLMEAKTKGTIKVIWTS